MAQSKVPRSINTFGTGMLPAPRSLQPPSSLVALHWQYNWITAFASSLARWVAYHTRAIPRSTHIQVRRKVTELLHSDACVMLLLVRGCLSEDACLQ